MKNGTILLFRMPEKPTLVQKAIAYFTGKPWTHAAIFHDGYVYEALLKGVTRTFYPEWAIHNKPEERWDPVSSQERRRMQVYLETGVNLQWKYNVLKLLVLAIVYPTRWVWKRIGWVPFDWWVFGEICSGLVDKAWLAEGVDIIRKQRAGYTAPGDLRNLPDFVLV